MGSFGGAMVQSPSDASAEEIPQGDLDTVRAYAQRVKSITNKFVA